jgi:RNA polymerase sigma-70 factor (ECF subfamily)
MPPAPSLTMPRSDEAVADALLDATRRVLRYLRFLGARDGADDVVQETLLAGLARWPDGDAPLPWLLATARNLWRRHLRSHGRRRELCDCDRLHGLWVVEAGDDGGEALRAALRACLQQLPDRSRRALELRYGEGLEREAIAAQLGLGDEGVKSLLARLRAVLAECVGRRMRRGRG